MKRVKVKAGFHYLGFSAIFLLLSIFICYMNLRLKGFKLITIHYAKEIAIVSIPTGFSAGWAAYSVFKYKIKPVGYAIEKAKLTIEGTIIFFVLFFLLSLIL